MKCMIVLLAVVGACTAQWGGHGAPAPVQDTPEVAAAKAAHFAAVAQAQANPAHQQQDNGQWNDQGQWNPPQQNQWNPPQQNQWNPPQQQWNPPQQQQWNPPQQNQWNPPPQQNQRWTGPLALPPGFDKNGAPLPVQDTPEVAALKAAQLNTLARSGGNVPAPGWNPAPAAPAWNQQQQWSQPQQNQWNQPQQNQWNQHGNSGHGRWRRSLILAAPAIVPLTSYPGSTAPLVRSVVAPVASYAPLVRSVHAPLIATPHIW